MKAYKLKKLPNIGIIEIGWDGENNWRPISVDCSEWFATHPSGIVTFWIQPRDVEQAFAVAVTRTGNIVTWTPLNEEMTSEYGELQIQCNDGTSVGKSAVVQWHRNASLVPGAEHPAEMPSWAVRVVEATGHYPKIENGTWWVWDVQNGEWADTGVSAGGDVSPEQIEAAVEDYLDEHPIQFTETDPTVPQWAKQPEKPTYTAQEVGALPADTPIPAAVTEQTVAGWGFTKNTGTYSKPSGGIPKTDLAQAVQTSLGKADTALQQHQSLAGYATESYVQTQIAAIPDELPDATSASANDFLCLNAQKQPIWKTVPSAESSSFGGGS